MKCKKCGTNLQIDDAVCPYCGAVNPVAKKHREDMKKYAKDYDETKSEVVGKSKRVNNKTIMVAAIAITVAAVIALIFFAGISDALKRDHQKRVRSRNLKKSRTEIQRLIEEEDYLALDEFARGRELVRSSGADDPYKDLLRITSAYGEIYATLMAIIGEQKTTRLESLASIIGSDLGTIARIESMEFPEDCRQYVEHLQRDTYLLLHTYLHIDEAEYKEWLEMSSSRRNPRIWEVVNECKKAQ